MKCKAVFSLLTHLLQLNRALLTSPAGSAAPWSPWHTPGSSAGIAAGSVSPSKESESQTAPNWKLPDSPKNFTEKTPKGQALFTKLEIHEGRLRIHSERKQVGCFHVYICKPCKQPLWMDRKISEFSGVDTIPTQTERPRYTVTNTVSTPKKTLFFTSLTPADGSTTLLLKCGKAKIRLTAAELN